LKSLKSCKIAKPKRAILAGGIHSIGGQSRSGGTIVGLPRGCIQNFGCPGTPTIGCGGIVFVVVVVVSVVVILQHTIWKEGPHDAFLIGVYPTGH
jgi:hypothetical protein